MENTLPPLAERLRPQKLEDLLGQEHLTGPGSVLRQSIAQHRIPSMILWGPPGVGKTTIAYVISRELKRPFHTLSAISSGVREVREVIEEARGAPGTVLFIDEIHRFNKGQQDALLGAVEKGLITLIGATTENPSFEVNSALLSRCQVFLLKPLKESDLEKLLRVALTRDLKLRDLPVRLEETGTLIRLSGGDARKLYNLLELVVDSFAGESEVVVTDARVMEVAQRRVVLYDKKGEQHYDIISAFIKSMRGSDPNAAVYWLARMIEAGEDVEFIARRMVILASEDIGNANPTALVLANNTFQAVHSIGYPEARIILSQCAVYLSCSPKSNASYRAISAALDQVARKGDLSVPLHLRNAPTGLMKKEGYGKGYEYSHDFEGNFSAQEYLPPEIAGTPLYDPGANPREEELRRRLRELWGTKYGY
ncbi:MAG TPA: replication-associated recombination protein A [Chitinophagaceae bacterium]|nr:replication-associated recombination protein A [Chitinophagaceae bacterium]